MPRENFKITFNGTEVIKHKWNSSIREIESIVRDLAKSENTVYELVNSVSNKEGFNYTNGSRTWKSAKGDVAVFEITKL